MWIPRQAVFLVTAAEVLALLTPTVMAGSCMEDLRAIGFAKSQQLIPLKNDMEQSCNSLVNQETDECSSDCDRNVDRLLNLYEGKPTYFTCDCSHVPSFDREEDCEIIHTRLVVCPTLANALEDYDEEPLVYETTTPTVLVNGRMSCDMAHENCLANGNCKTQLESTIASCTPDCSNNCKASLDTLLVLHQAQGLWECTGCTEGSDWCGWSTRCPDEPVAQGTVGQYRPDDGEKERSKESETEDGTENGISAMKSVKPGENGAHRSWEGFYSKYVILALTALITWR